MTRLLLVEDDLGLAESLSRTLRAEGFEVQHAASAREATAGLSSHPAVVLLDWMLADGSGLDWLKRARAEGMLVPVIFLTARADIVDRVVGLEAGASDYMVKPFEPRELVARIRVQLRGSQRPGGTVLRWGDVSVDRDRRSVEVKDSAVEMTRKEFDLLLLLLENPARAFSREELLNRVWGYDCYPTTRTVDTHVLQLRTKLDPELVETVRGVGYRLSRSRAEDIERNKGFYEELTAS